ncbi:MAG: hypothetical protein ACHP8A_16995 [Terriglobales bacterium]|jgi:hypothetical protein|nr:hypothetical protein [Terriglobales bacterium]
MKTKAIMRRALLAVSAAVVISVPASFVTVHADDSLPKVSLNADNLGPRSIEELTSKVVARDYAFAWQTMAEALEQNRPDLLDGYFTGIAKQDLAQMIADQTKTGVRVRYVDHGHKLDALFYSPAGDAMQLRDHADLEINVMDGQKVIHSEQVNLQYTVLMTPGADRWLVRDLEVAPEAKP